MTAKIAQTAAANILAIFAGQTVTMDAISDQIETEYAAAGKRVGFRSFFNIDEILEAHGVVGRYSGPNYSGIRYYTFPAA